MDCQTMINSQYELGKRIEQIITNCKKAGKPRRTSQFFTEKIAELQNQLEQLHARHNELCQHDEIDLNHEYFTSNYYEKIQAPAIQYIKTLEMEAMQLQKESVATGGGPLELTPATRKLLRNQKALIEVIRKNVTEIMTERDMEHPTSYYSVKAAVLEKHMIDLSSNNSAIWEAIEDDCIENYTPQTYYELEAEVAGAMIELQQHFNEGTPSNALQEQASGYTPLPRISLPKFNGDYMQWVAFKDLFTELVHNASTNNTQRMHYLNNALTDEPKSLIKHLPAIGSNYAAAWEILTSRYDNKRLLVSTLLHTLLSQPGLKPDSASSMKSLHDVTKECIHGLKAQGLPVHHWDALIAYVVLKKMDPATQTAFEQSLSDSKRLITQDEIMKFLEKRFQSLEVRHNKDKIQKRTCGTVINNNEKCSVCKQGNHQLYTCSKFKAAQIHQKWQYVKDLKLCANCLRPGHLAAACKSQHCTKCTKKHNTLLHSEPVKKSIPATNMQNNTTSLAVASANPSPEENLDTATSLLVNKLERNSNYVLLGTAKIILEAANGRSIECRAVLDSGSQVNLITERLQRKLGVSSSNTPLCIEGVGSNETSTRHQTTMTVRSKINKFTTEMVAHIIPKIVSDQPAYFIKTDQWNIPQNFVLADPDFAKPGQIDCLIGAAIFFDLLTKGALNLGANLPTLKNTVFGWVVAGTVEISNRASAVCGICTSAELDKVISNFWKMEEVPETSPSMTEDDLRCEAHFVQHTKRAQDGKFIVRLPLKAHPSTLVDSKGMAYERFKAIERRLDADASLKSQYVNFMREYEQLGHMTQVWAKDIATPCYFIPHHCVLRPESTSTKLRVVFDASATKPSKPSLNDIMYTGPTVQSELFSILLRFRIHRYVLKTDVEKMYRQIWIHNDDRNLQLIMWRESSNQPIKYFKLNTVTYGTRAAPYLATRCLKELAIRHKGCYSYGAQSLHNDFYVDDGLIGADTIREALETQGQLIKMLGEAGMKLRKWCANDERLLHGIPQEDQEVDLNLNSEGSPSTKTLGILWVPKTDAFCIRANVQKHAEITKRTMTSDLAHIYDPLGLIAPVVVTGKIHIQQVWQIKLDWDEALPAEIKRQWIMYRTDLEHLNNTTFPRYVFGKEKPTNIQLHAFADASERAYGAAIYVRSVQPDKSIKINLLCAKSRVAPIKVQTIPRLELCAALLAAELMSRVRMDLNYHHAAVFFWTDSQIVLSWIKNHQGTLLPYVAHRIIKIRNLSESHQWQHVRSKQNPADILSRGLKPSELAACVMWFYGPMFLYQNEPTLNKQVEVVNTQVSSLATNKGPEEKIWIYEVPSKNSFRFIQGVIGYVLRFTTNARKPKESRPDHTQLTANELDSALKLIVRQIQASDFPDLKKTLLKDRFVPKTNQYSSLTPFLDEEGVIRVGGRISASHEPFDAIHQMILPGKDPLVKLLVEKIHKENYHCSAKALLAIVRQRFWPVKNKGLIRSVLQHCVRCIRARPALYKQIMGNLPANRVQPARPFLNSGVDYCGPFWVHFKTRGKRPQKAYLCVFCCFATKATHLELVTDLTTDAFIGALKRFIGRRGHCKNLFCDNATNFVGAKNQLMELKDIIYSTRAKEDIINACSMKGIEFNFIPPRSPHFGGLWEAAVKSAKQLLIKNVASKSLTYEELETVVIEIEAILNSRPLIPMSSDPNDLNALTPGHILIGEPLLTNVDVHAQHPTGKLLHRWQLVSEIKHNFWKRWSTEYLCELQERHKWKGPVSNVQPNTLVIMKVDNMPVQQWPLGRIIKVYPGEDGVVRVCDVKTKNGVFKRAVHNLAPLFPEQEDQNGVVSESQQEVDKTQQPPVSLLVSIPLSRIKDVGSLTSKSQPEENITQQSPVSLLASIPLSRIRNADSLSNPPIHKKVPRLNTGLMLTIITLFLLPLALCSPISITKFNNTPGVYFEQLQTIKQVTAKWNMVVYLDLTPYEDQVKLLHNGISTLQRFCDNTTYNTPCKYLLYYFNKTTEELETEFNILDVKRTKRGALDVVGNIANSLFGVLDSNYATAMSRTINDLKNDDKTLEELLNKQTSVIDSTINVMKKHQLSTQAKFAEIDLRLNELLNGKNSVNEMQMEQNILMLSMNMFILESRLHQIQSSILDVIVDSHHGKINPLLLTPEQLYQEILKIKSHLPPRYQLPFHQNNIIEAYQLLNIKGIVAESHMIFSVELPLTDPREFRLLHLLPIVAAINNTLAAINLSTEFLAISPHHDEFFTMQPAELDKCQSFNDNELMCANIQSIHHPNSDVSTCEIELFNNKPNPRCEAYPIKDKTKWYQLQHPNQWIFATLEIIKLNAVCGEETLQLELEASGLLQLQPDCIIKNDIITIHSQQNFTSSIHVTTKTFGIPLGWPKQYLSSNLSLIPFKTNGPELTAIQEQLEHIKSSHLPANSKKTTHSITISYITLALMLVFIFIIMARLKNLKRKSKGPVPLPRYQINNEETVC